VTSEKLGISMIEVRLSTLHAVGVTGQRRSSIRQDWLRVASSGAISSTTLG